MESPSEQNASFLYNQYERWDANDVRAASDADLSKFNIQLAHVLSALIVMCTKDICSNSPLEQKLKDLEEKTLACRETARANMTAMLLNMHVRHADAFRNASNEACGHLVGFTPEVPAPDEAKVAMRAAEEVVKPVGGMAVPADVQASDEAGKSSVLLAVFTDASCPLTKAVDRIKELEDHCAFLECQLGHSGGEEDSGSGSSV